MENKVNGKKTKRRIKSLEGAHLFAEEKEREKKAKENLQQQKQSETFSRECLDVCVPVRTRLFRRNFVCIILNCVNLFEREEANCCEEFSLDFFFHFILVSHSKQLYAKSVSNFSLNPFFVSFILVPPWIWQFVRSLKQNLFPPKLLRQWNIFSSAPKKKWQSRTTNRFSCGNFDKWPKFSICSTNNHNFECEKMTPHTPSGAKQFECCVSDDDDAVAPKLEVKQSNCMRRSSKVSIKTPHRQRHKGKKIKDFPDTFFAVRRTEC